MKLTVLILAVCVFAGSFGGNLLVTQMLIRQPQPPAGYVSLGDGKWYDPTRETDPRLRTTQPPATSGGVSDWHKLPSGRMNSPSTDQIMEPPPPPPPGYVLDPQGEETYDQTHDQMRPADLGATLFAFVAAILWFMSAFRKPEPIIAYHAPTPESDPYRRSLEFSAKMNRWAALFTGMSALCMFFEHFTK